MAEPTFSDDQGLNVPVQLPAELAGFLAQPNCVDIALPKPQSGTIRLPTGGSIPAIANFAEGIPDNCSVSVSLMTQIGPLVGSLDCIIKLLGLIGPLTEVIKGLPFPPAKAIADFVKATPPVLECLAAFTPGGGIVLFVKDIICLVVKMLRCLLDQLNSIISAMESLQLQITAAEGNPQLLANLECAQENVQCAAQGALQSIDPVRVILELIEPLADIAQLPFEGIPSLSDSTELEPLRSVVSTLDEVANALELAVGGCE